MPPIHRKSGGVWMLWMFADSVTDLFLGMPARGGVVCQDPVEAPLACISTLQTSKDL